MWWVVRLVPFLQFKKREKHPWKSVTFSEVAGFSLQALHSTMGVFHVFKIVQKVPNRVKHHKCRKIILNYVILNSLTQPEFTSSKLTINTRTICEICSKLIRKTPEQHQWRRSGVFIANFEHISQLVLKFLLLTLNM